MNTAGGDAATSTEDRQSGPEYFRTTIGGSAAPAALVTDLDGSLIATDTLWEGVVSIVRRAPARVGSLAGRLMTGRAAFKAEVAKYGAPDAAGLPYRADVLEYLRSERAKGRRIVLATAAHKTVADSVANHLGLFDEVFASTDQVNLKGAQKRDALVKRFGVKGFDYIGDSISDKAVWQACRVAHVVGSSASAGAAGAETGKRFGGPAAGARKFVRAIRMHQWVKNILVCVPTLLNHTVSWHILESLAIAFAGFSLVASGTYLFNDLLDLEADRGHPLKRRRPLPSGEMSIAEGAGLGLLLISSGLGLSLLAGLPLLVCLVAYLALTICYSTWIKSKPVLDVVALAVLYTLRVFAGGLVTGAYVSPWLFQFSIFLFLSLAFVKRYSELVGLRQYRRRPSERRSYTIRDMSIVGQAGLGSGLLACVVLALYVNGREVEKLYRHPEMLWSVCPLFAYWIIRVWLIAHRGNMREDPVLYAFHDRVSYIVGTLIAAAVVLGLMPNAQ
ncbi:MAG TPA: UbiA family prenyltransferase [Bryobacteraceae bacterium]